MRNLPGFVLSVVVVPRMSPVALALALGCGGAPSATPPQPREASSRPSIDPRLGDLSELEPAVRRAFEAGPEDFAELPTPAAGDWLALHDEQPQSVGAYWVADPNRPGADGRDTLYIVPIDEVASVDGLAAYAHDFFVLDVEVLPTIDLETIDVEKRMNGPIEQLRAPDLQAHLQSVLPRDAYALIGITMHDLYPGEDWNYVFGLASLTHRTGVFSLRRYDPRFYDGTAAPDPELAQQRAFKIMTHELGHMFGITHCVHHRCLMNGANHPGELDTSPLTLCPVCLRKLHMLLGFDPAERYEALRAQYLQHDMTDAAAFVDRRLRRIHAGSPAR